MNLLNFLEQIVGSVLVVAENLLVPFVKCISDGSLLFIQLGEV